MSYVYFVIHACLLLLCLILSQEIGWEERPRMGRKTLTQSINQSSTLDDELQKRHKIPYGIQMTGRKILLIWRITSSTLVPIHDLLLSWAAAVNIDLLTGC